MKYMGWNLYTIAINSINRRNTEGNNERLNKQGKTIEYKVKHNT